VAYQKMEFIGFIHFSMNTFTDMEWGFGDESPELFDPTALDTDQWARVAAEVGMGELILTAKHHDGFTLWPSEYSHHSVADAPWRGGGGNLVGEFAESAGRRGVKVGLYLSPWDRNHPEYGREAYLDAYRGQLRELLTQFGEVTEIWVDGANGGTGYYGGANEERRIDRKTYYRWPETMGLVKELQPHALIFSDAGPDIRWMGNERGHAGETNWSTIDTDGIVIGDADTDYLNTGDPNGAQWVVPLCNTSIRPGWFYHANQDDQVKSPQELVDLYYRSVGLNCVLLLNVPPDRRGLFHETDVETLGEFRRVLDETFAVNLAVDAEVTADNVRGVHGKFGAGNVVDQSVVAPNGPGGGGAPEMPYDNAADPPPLRSPGSVGNPGIVPPGATGGNTRTYWAADDGRRSAVLELQLPRMSTFDRILLQEPIRLGQRISGFSVEAMIGGEWREVARGTTVGYKRILRISQVSTDRVRLVIEDALAPPAISNMGLFRASPDEGWVPSD
jgi:alpha-L-fucosidase